MRVYLILLIQIIFVSFVNGWTFSPEYNVRATISAAIFQTLFNTISNHVLPEFNTVINGNAAMGRTNSDYEYIASVDGLQYRIYTEFQYSTDRGNINVFNLANTMFMATLDAFLEQLMNGQFYQDFGIHFYCSTCDQPAGGMRFRINHYRPDLKLLSDTGSFSLKVDETLDNINGVKDPKYTSGGIGIDLSQSIKTLYPQFSASRSNDKASVAATATCRNLGSLGTRLNYFAECGTSNAVIPYYKLYKGSSRWSRDGLKRLFVQSNGDICIWHYPKGVPTMLWCWSHGIDFTKDKGFFGAVTDRGQLCLYSYHGGPARVCSDSSKKGDAHYLYRMVIENTGLLAMYEGFNPALMWSNNFYPFPKAQRISLCDAAQSLFCK